MGERERILGAVLAGGKSRRFGTDKAEALIDGKPMLDHIIEALLPQVNHLVICGRDWKGFEKVADRPQPGLGPLSGLDAALSYARQNGFHSVLTVPVDVVPLPSDFARRLMEQAPSVFEEQYLIGYWPVAYAKMLDDYLAIAPDVAFHNWLDHVSVHKIKEPVQLFNVNTPADLERYSGS